MGVLQSRGDGIHVQAPLLAAIILRQQHAAHFVQPAQGHELAAVDGRELFLRAEHDGPSSVDGAASDRVP